MWQPAGTMVDLLPEKPTVFVDLRKLPKLVDGFNQSEFGQQVKQMPILKQIGSGLRAARTKEPFQEVTFDFNSLLPYLRRQAVLALYPVQDSVELTILPSWLRTKLPISFLILTEVDTLQKLRISALTILDPINGAFTLTTTTYRQIRIQTLAQDPESELPALHYAFLGRIGMVSPTLSTIKRVIDVFRGSNINIAGNSKVGPQIKSKYQDAKYTIYLNLPELWETFDLSESALISPIQTWTATQHTQNRILYTRHYLTLRRPIRSLLQQFQVPVDRPFAVTSTQLAAQIKGVVSLMTLIWNLSGQSVNPATHQTVADNLRPLESLGTIEGKITATDQAATLDLQISFN